MANAKLGTKAVGSIVKLKVNGAAKEFIVVHQGKPGSMYDESCNGTWLLMKDIYESRQWHSTNTNYLEYSTIHSYLNSTFLNLFESNIRDAIKQVKIPYRKNGGGGGAERVRQHTRDVFKHRGRRGKVGQKAQCHGDRRGDGQNAQPVLTEKFFQGLPSFHRRAGERLEELDAKAREH